MTDQEKTTIKQELETEFPRGTGLETRPRTKLRRYILFG